MSLDKILKLGDPGLFDPAHPVERHELDNLTPVIKDLHKTIVEFRKKYGVGRAIAAPQIGISKRIICWNIDRPLTLINPVLSELSDELFEVWDDCMCFPGLLVKVKRHFSCRVNFLNNNWKIDEWDLTGDESELIQHEVDHLDGILATQRAVDGKSFKSVKL